MFAKNLRPYLLFYASPGCTILTLYIEENPKAQNCSQNRFLKWSFSTGTHLASRNEILPERKKISFPQTDFPSRERLWLGLGLEFEFCS